MGVAFVRGLQGDDLAAGVIATAKHFVGYGASEGGLNWAPAHIGARELREVYLHPFEAAVRDGGVRRGDERLQRARRRAGAPPTAACSPRPARRVGLRGLRRSRTTSRSASSPTTTASPSTPAEAAAMALDAGLDVELPGTDCFGAPLLRGGARRVGCREATVDAAVAPGARRPSSSSACSSSRSSNPTRRRRSSDPPAHRRLARDDRPQVARAAAQRRRPARWPASGRIAVIGPNADDARHLFGDYTTRPTSSRSQEVLQSGRNVFADAARPTPPIPTTRRRRAHRRSTRLRARFGR